MSVLSSTTSQDVVAAKIPSKTKDKDSDKLNLAAVTALSRIKPVKVESDEDDDWIYDASLLDDEEIDGSDTEDLSPKPTVKTAPSKINAVASSVVGSNDEDEEKEMNASSQVQQQLTPLESAYRGILSSPTRPVSKELFGDYLEMNGFEENKAKILSSFEAASNDGAVVVNVFRNRLDEDDFSKDDIAAILRVLDISAFDALAEKLS